MYVYVFSGMRLFSYSYLFGLIPSSFTVEKSIMASVYRI